MNDRTFSCGLPNIPGRSYQWFVDYCYELMKDGYSVEIVSQGRWPWGRSAGDSPFIVEGGFAGYEPSS